MKIQGKVFTGNPTSSFSPASENDIRLGNTGELINSSLHGEHYEAVYRNSVFNAGVIGQVTTVGLTTTYTGLCLSNPIGSNVNLVLLKAGWSFIVAFPAGSAIGLMTGYNPSTNVTHTTPITPKSQLIGSGTVGTGLIDSAATLSSTPLINTILDAGLTGAITTTPFGSAGLSDINGSIILAPGAFCAFYTSTVSGAAGGHFSFTWEEVPR